MARKRARLRFYAELNDFLAPAARFSEIERAFDVESSVKDMIEACGVPHTEVDLIVVDGESVDFSRRVRDGDRISVFPMFESIDIASELRVRPEPLREIRFVADAHLGTLARYLRLLGFDCVYRRDSEDHELATVSAQERRVLLTRDVGLLKRSMVTHGYFMRATDPGAQAKEVLQRFDLGRLVDPFTRCMRCNGRLEEVSKEEIEAGLPEGTRRRYDEFRKCIDCGRPYWKGAHYPRLAALIEEVADTERSGHRPASGHPRVPGGDPGQ